MEVKELIDLMKRERVLRVKMGGLEVELSPMAFAPDAVPEADAKSTKPSMPEDFTLWSVQGNEPIAVFERVEEKS